MYLFSTVCACVFLVHSVFSDLLLMLVPGISGCVLAPASNYQVKNYWQGSSLQPVGQGTGCGTRTRTLTLHKGLVQKRAVIFSVKHHVGRWVRSLCSEPWSRQVSGYHRRGTAEDAPRGVGDPKSEPDSKVRCVDGTLHGKADCGCCR